MIAALLAPVPAYAADPAGSGAIVGAFAWLQGTLMGNVATTAAVIAVAMVGFMMLTGRMNWRLARRSSWAASSCSARPASWRASSRRRALPTRMLGQAPVFRALTRPQMFGGVTYSFFVINAALTTEVFLITRSFLALPVALLVHGAGYVACLREPRIFDLWLT